MSSRKSLPSGKPMMSDPVRQALAMNNPIAALRYAANYRHLGPQAVRIRQAYSAYQNQRFYREMGRDVETMIRDGIAAIKERFE